MKCRLALHTEISEAHDLEHWYYSCKTNYDTARFQISTTRTRPTPTAKMNKRCTTLQHWNEHEYFVPSHANTRTDSRLANTCTIKNNNERNLSLTWLLHAFGCTSPQDNVCWICGTLPLCYKRRQSQSNALRKQKLQSPLRICLLCHLDKKELLKC